MTAECAKAVLDRKGRQPSRPTAKGAADDRFNRNPTATATAAATATALTVKDAEVAKDCSWRMDLSSRASVPIPGGRVCAESGGAVVEGRSELLRRQDAKNFPMTETWISGRLVDPETPTPRQKIHEDVRAARSAAPSPSSASSAVDCSYRPLTTESSTTSRHASRVLRALRCVTGRARCRALRSSGDRSRSLRATRSARRR